jgi:hypothetical protein
VAAAVPLLLLPLLLVAGNAVYWVLGQPDPWRSAEVLLGLGALAAAAGAWWRPRPAAIPVPAVGIGRWPPSTWLLALLVWLAISLAWSAHPALGVIGLAERAAALAAALGIAALTARRPLPVWVLPVIGAAVLVLAATSGIRLREGGLTQPPSYLGNWLLGPGAARPRVAEQPFGLNNFNLAAAPLLAVALGALVARGDATSGRRPVVVLGGIFAAGLAALVIIGGGVGTDHSTTAAWYVLLAMAGAASALRLPRRWAPVAYVAVVAVPLLIQLGCVAAARLPVAVPPSIIDRFGIWLGARDAFLAAPLFGYGTGTGAVAISSQPIRAIGWLAVPGFPEHAHHEAAQFLLDGGLLALLLILPAIWLTLRALWRRRDEPLVAGLLTGWAVALCQSLVESHLAQPGPLLLLALLAGTSWGVAARPAGTAAAPSAPVGGDRWPLLLLALVATVGIGATIRRTHAWRGPAGLDHHHTMQQVAAATTATEKLQLLSDLEERIGDVDAFAWERIRLLAATDPAAALPLACGFGARLPIHLENLNFLNRSYADLNRGDTAGVFAAAVGAIMTEAQRLISHPLLDRLRFADPAAARAFAAYRVAVNQELNRWDAQRPRSR